MPLCPPSVWTAVGRLRIQSAAQRNQLAFWRLAQASQARNNSPPQPTPLLFEKLFDAAGERQRKALQVMVFVDVRLAFLHPQNKHLVVRLLVATDPFERLLSEVLADACCNRFVHLLRLILCLRDCSNACSNDAQTMFKCVLTIFCD